MNKFAFIVAVVTWSLSGCGSPDYSSDDDVGYDYSESSKYDGDGPAFGGSEYGETEDERDPFDEDQAREAAEEEIASETYGDIGSPYGCRDDCSGHEAGFRWRAEHGYQGFNADSPSFNEGGQAFEDAVEERVEEMQSDYDAGEDPDY